MPFASVIHSMPRGQELGLADQVVHTSLGHHTLRKIVEIPNVHGEQSR